MSRWFLILFGFSLLLNTTCKKESTDDLTIDSGSLLIIISYNVDDDSLTFNNIKYVNSSNNKYSVTKLHYYLSGIKLTNKNNQIITIPNSYYVNAELCCNPIVIDKIPAGNYQAIQFYIGLDSLNNISNKLEPTIENLNMAWPNLMGGGYHFLKLEGNYLDSLLNQKGFAIHLGNNQNLVKHNVLPINVNITNQSTSHIKLAMNINEWFTNPSHYNLALDGQYTMSSNQLMKIISLNGSNVFTHE